MSPFDLLQPVLAAAGTSFAVLLVAALLSLWKREPARRMAIWLAPACGFVAGAWLVRGLPALPPVDAPGWIFWSLCGLAVVGCCLPVLPWWARWAGRIIVVPTLLFLMLQPLLDRLWEETGEKFLWLGGTGLIWLIVWGAIAQSDRAPHPWRPLLLLLLTAIGLSVLLMISGTASYSFYVLALAGSIAGAGLAALLFPKSFGPDPRPAAAMIAVPWMGLLVSGYFYAEMVLPAVLVMAAAPLSLLLPALPKVKKLSITRLLLIQLAWTILALATAVILAHLLAPQYDY